MYNNNPRESLPLNPPFMEIITSHPLRKLVLYFNFYLSSNFVRHENGEWGLGFNAEIQAADKAMVAAEALGSEYTPNGSKTWHEIKC